MAWDPTLEYDFSSLPLFRTLMGSAVTYFVWPEGGIEYEIMGFEVSDGGNSRDTDVRERRRQLAKSGKPVPPMSEGSLKDILLIVLFGPETGAEEAVRSLRKMADLIEKKGLVTGRRREGYAKEYVSGRNAKQVSPVAGTSSKKRRGN
jgi:hypothetical protein